MSGARALSRLVIASHNAGKVEEIKKLLAPFGIEAVGAAESHLPAPEESRESFAGNAALKAEAAAASSGLPALADDSGLCVAALGGAPGVYSARWAGPKKDFRLAMNRVERELKKKGADRRACFICALALARPGRDTEIFEGKVDGTLVFPPRGSKGFGYDPIFLADGETLTFGEMDPVKKHTISHRARAFAKLVHSLRLPAPAR